jgi:hypothetical protein
MKSTLHHPATGSRYDVPLYVNRAGRPFYLIGGASDEGVGEGGTDAGPGAESTGTESSKTDADVNLGDAGKKALEAERNARKEADKRAKAAESELEKLRSANKTDAEKAVDAARKEGAAEALKTANTRLINAELRAVAVEAKMRDPRDAGAQLRAELDKVEVGADGEVDTDAIKALVTDLKKNKPYLFEDGTTTTSSARDAGIGASGGGGKADPGPGRARIRSAIEASSK